MNHKAVENTIVEWLKKELETRGLEGFVIGISGGVDSALVSTLCAKTLKPVLVLSLPISQAQDQLERAHNHIAWLQARFSNITNFEIDLTEAYETLRKTFIKDIQKDNLAMANLKARLRMSVLYAHAGHFKYLVSGTGNAIEDYKVFYYTKYGDGAADISPIGDLSKSQVWELAKYIGINDEIVTAKPTDGLWPDNRGDEDAIGATYPELEWAASFCETHNLDLNYTVKFNNYLLSFNTSQRKRDILKIYQQRYIQGKHKAEPIPVCIIPKIIL